MKTLSDVAMMADGTFGIEWQETSGGRWWERFPTESERAMALCEYQEWLDANIEEVEKEMLEQKLEYIEQMIAHNDAHTNFEKLQVLWYTISKDNKELLWSDYQEFYKNHLSYYKN